ncbi:hypothetical protein [Leisingera sp. ANG-M1]|uniref:hypothetical protein n=1 Tax=Leisingera sp. ANG-M1 TaxID=1577895 RepID=UPI000AED296C|nr:hypothetical protein [Leisingera sp. ANG-M1]
MLRGFSLFFQALGFSLGFVLLAAPAAADAFTACVQRQLADLGYDPGRTNGTLVPATQRAWQNLRAAHHGVFKEHLAELPPLSRKTAMHWCRELPALQPGLGKHLPSAAPVLLLADAPNVEKGVQRAYDQTRRFMDKEYGIVLAGNIAIAAAGSTRTVQGYVRRLLAELTPLKYNPDASIAAHCDTTFGVAGAAYLRFMYICWDNPHQADKAWLKRAKHWLGSMMAHEYMHLVQAELSGARAEGWNSGAVRRRMGPHWLVEGGAELVAARFRKKVLRHRSPGLEELREGAQGSRKSLKGMRVHKAVGTEADYDLAHYAVHVLTRISGEDALFGFWRRLGTGESWEQAFQQSFGLDMAEFEAQVTELRKTRGAARAYIAKMRRRSS